MANDITLGKGWKCDGSELKPSSGANTSNTWVLSGKDIKQKVVPLRQTPGYGMAKNSNQNPVQRRPILGWSTVI